MSFFLKRQRPLHQQRPEGRRRRIGLWIAGAMVLAYAFWLALVVLKTPPLKVDHENSLSPRRGEIIGAYHLHTRFSDGRGSVEDVVRAARRNHLDFIILTDHGSPNFACLQSQGWRDGVLVLAGSELSTNRGHLVGLGLSAPNFLLPQRAEEAARLIQMEGGFSIIAHPFSKVSWSWGKDNEPFAGIELIDADTMLKKNWPASIPYLPLLALQPRLFVLRMIDPFLQPLRQWDGLNLRRPGWYGFFSIDAHLLYGPLLSLFHLRIPAETSLPSEFKAARKTVLEALRRGAFYNSVDAAQPADGFRFWAERGEERFPMGSLVQVDPESPLTLRLQVPSYPATATSLLHNGQPILLSPEKEIHYLARQPGFYRVEVYFQGESLLKARVPWIVSNPIFLVAGKP